MPGFNKVKDPLITRTVWQRICSWLIRASERGTQHESLLRNAVVSTGAPSREGFYGFEPVISPDRNKATISLDLKLKEIPASFTVSR